MTKYVFLMIHHIAAGKLWSQGDRGVNLTPQFMGADYFSVPQLSHLQSGK